MKEDRICDSCGFHNSLGSLFCENEKCGEDISHLPPTRLDEQEATEHVKPTNQMKTMRMTGISLVNTASGYEIPIPVEGGVLGRSGTIQPEHFQNSLFVSNEHAKIQLSKSGYVIVDLDSTNGTKINGTKIVSGIEHPIHEGTRITLANLEYVVEVPGKF